MPSDAPTSSASTPAGTRGGPSSVLRGFRYSTGARGGALYGGALTASPIAASIAGSFASTPITVPDRRHGVAAIEGSARQAGRSKVAFSASGRREGGLDR